MTDSDRSEVQASTPWDPGLEPAASSNQPARPFHRLGRLRTPQWWRPLMVLATAVTLFGTAFAILIVIGVLVAITLLLQVLVVAPRRGTRPGR
ncbi:MAG: hypothetical protein ACK5KO_00440 [Arachnia sp.]